MFTRDKLGVEVQNVGQSNLSILISLLVFPCYYIWVRTNCHIIVVLLEEVMTLLNQSELENSVI
jgi:hypothetical protein